MSGCPIRVPQVQHMDSFERSVFATLLMTGLRKRELYFLTWRDLDLKAATLEECKARASAVRSAGARRQSLTSTAGRDRF